MSVTPRARTHADRGGDPLEGLVNLFDLGIVLAVGFLLAALSALDLTEAFTRRDPSAVVRPGAAQREVVVRAGERVERVRRRGERVVGEGERIGSVFRLDDGRTVIVTGR